MNRSDRLLGLKNSWICDGIADRLFSDNGREFLSRSLKRSAHDLRFDHILLPVMSPWLKGSLERFWGTMNIQVFAHRPGKTFSNSIMRGDYKSLKRAEVPLSKVRFDTLEWIVDDYQVSKHHGLQDASPIEVWHELIARQGGVRPVGRFEQIVELTGQVIRRQIGNNGIEIHGLTYFSEELTYLRRRRGGLAESFEVRFDPFDMSEIWVLDEPNGRHLTVPCEDQEISRGVSAYAAKLHLKIAKRSGSLGKVTKHDLLLAKQRAEAEKDALFADCNLAGSIKAAARYDGANADFFTPLVGQKPRSALLPRPTVITEPAGQTEGAALQQFDPVAEHAAIAALISQRHS